jgi:ribosome-interacting GTPase 1
MRIGIVNDKVGETEQTIQHPKKALIVGNKVDLPGASQNFEALQNKYQGMVPIVAISARNGISLEEMKRKLYEILDIIRVYTKVPGQKPDLRDPLVLKRGSTLEEAAGQLHKDLKARLKYARVWGSGKHDGVMVKRDHVLQDGDIIELHV